MSAAGTLFLVSACSLIADTSDTQCTTDADCAALNPASALARPTCNAGVCEVPVCTPPSDSVGSATVLVPGVFYPPRADGRLPAPSDAQPMSGTDFVVHACGRNDPDCARRSCGWQSAGVNGVVMPGVPAAFFPVQVPLPFDGYFVVQANTDKYPDFVVSSVFPPNPVTADALALSQGVLPGTPLVGGSNANFVAAAYAASTTIDPTTGGLFVLPYEGTGPAQGIEVNLISLDGTDALVKFPAIKRAFLDESGVVAPGVESTQTNGVIYVNVPTGSFRVTASKGGITVGTNILSIVGLANTTSLFLPPASTAADAGADGG